MSPQLIAGFLTLIACFMVLCRVDKMMRGVTKGSVFVQHALLGICMFASFVLSFTAYAEWAAALMAAGIVAFFMFSVKRWSHGAPEGTEKPMALDEAALRHISGGKR